MNSIQLSVQQLATLIEIKPKSIKALNQSDRKLVQKTFFLFQDLSNETKLEKQLTHIKNIVAKLEQSSPSKNLKKYCSSGFFHFIRSFFKGIANFLGRVSSEELVSNAHKICENFFKKSLSLPPKSEELDLLSQQKNKLKKKFEALKKDFIKYTPDIYQYFDDKGYSDERVEQEVRYREECIEMFFKVSEHVETIMKLYDQEDALRKEFWASADKYYPNHKHKFASNRYAEEHLKFIIHSENPRAEVETALKFGPHQLIETYEKSKNIDEKTLIKFFIHSFKRSDACFEIKNTTIGDYIAEITTNMHDTPTIQPDRLINHLLDLNKNAEAICDEFINREARIFCRNKAINIEKSPEEWDKQKKAIEKDKDFYKNHLNSNRLFKFLKDDVKAVGKKIAGNYVIQESDITKMVDYCVDILAVIERSTQ